MRDVEIAALTDEFFEPEFDQNSAIAMLGSPVTTDDLDDRTVTYLRPDARTLARVEVYAIAPREPGGAPFVDELLLVLRGARMYSRAQLEELLGPARKTEGPSNDEGEPSWQLEFDQARTLRGVVMMRWWPDAEDPEGMGDPGGPDEVRVEEVHLRRLAPEAAAEQVPGLAAGGAESTMLLSEDALLSAVDPSAERRPGAVDKGLGYLAPAPVATPVPAVDLDEAMDAGAWLANLAWRILRPDFTFERAVDLLGAAVQPLGNGPGMVALVPHDARLQQVFVELSEAGVAAVRMDAPPAAPLVVALDAVADRLNAPPASEGEALRFRFEATRSRGVVTLITAQGTKAGGPIVAIGTVEVTRG
jgi:hypothetical protein